MNFKNLPNQEKTDFTNLLFQPLSSPQELKDWIMLFLGLDMPIGSVDPDSNSSPIDAMWEIYQTVKNNTGNVTPGYIMLSARECYKTLGASILETLLMVHFSLTVAHMAAIQSQSAKAIQYINYFFNKIEPLLHHKGWVNRSQNKNKIEYRTESGADVYIKVVVATLSGANSEHTTLMFVDEIDVVKDPLAYEEAKLIPGYSKGIYPLTIKLSTRKFAFGLMQKEIDLAPISGDKILRWNIIDVTEKCPPSRHKPELPKEDRYVAKSLPLRQIGAEEYFDMSDIDKSKWELVKDAYAGCAGCALLPVCKTRLAHRDDTATKGLYKPIDIVMNTFKKVNPDMGEAQLMCWKPSSKGLVYPRFEGNVNEGNVITLERAFETLIGTPSRKKKVTEVDLLAVMKSLSVPFFAGVDWGYTHDAVIVIFAKIPNGEIWVVDCYSQAGLEFSDFLEVAKDYRDRYSPEKWFCDQAMPSHIKSFRKNYMVSPKFTKDVLGGIEALRSKIIDGYGRRMLKIIYRDSTKKVINTFQKHHFKLDTAGNPTLDPDDDAGISDQADAMRYVAQNLFPLKGPQKPVHTVTGEDIASHIDQSTPEGKLKAMELMEQAQRRSIHENQMREELAKLTNGGGNEVQGTGKRGGFFWSI